MKTIDNTYFFKVNFKDRYDEFWLREDIEAISSSLKYEFIEDLEIIRISHSWIYESEITLILECYNLKYVRYDHLRDQGPEHYRHSELLVS